MGLIDLSEQLRKIFCVTFADSSVERGDFEELLECTDQSYMLGREERFHESLHLMQNLEYTVVQVQSSVLVVGWQVVVFNELLRAFHNSFFSQRWAKTRLGERMRSGRPAR